MYLRKITFLVPVVMLFFLSASPAQAALSVVNATQPSPVPILTHTLSVSMAGDEVRTLQAFLRAQGYFTYPENTGWFGSITQSAVIEFQKANGIDPVGIVGPRTRALISQLSVPTLTVTDIQISTTTPKAKRKHHRSHASVPDEPSDTTAPTVSLTDPPTGFTHGSISLTADASDDTGVASVQFQIDATDVGAPVVSAPYTMSWDTSGVADGVHTITAIAQDAAGNATTSAGVEVTVDNTAPEVVITSPSSAEHSSPVVLAATVTEANSFTISLTITNAAPPNATMFSAGPLTLTPSFFVNWNTPATGSYVLQMQITDAAGNVTTATKAFNYSGLEDA